MDCEAEWTSDISVRSVDLQKIIMLPQIPGVNQLYLPKELSLFTTFASVGQRKPKNIAVEACWSFSPRNCFKFPCSNSQKKSLCPVSFIGPTTAWRKIKTRFFLLLDNTSKFIGNKCT